MSILIINGLGVILIGAIVRWFWLSKPNVIKSISNQLIEIKVKDGVYDPALIQVKINEPITLRFIREDANPCAEIVNFSSLNISKILPLYNHIDIQLMLQQAGEYEFTCQMGMYRGKLVAL